MSTLHDCTPRFRYRNLDSPESIRVLLLNPSSVSPVDLLHCDLIYTTISECDQDLFQHYVALSYVWGSTENLQTIILEGCKFEITRNLHDALHNIRDPSRVIRLWVDAICINQQDDNERNQQVALMGQIYSIAQHTIIYLGQSSPAIDAAFEKTAELENQSKSWKTICSDEHRVDEKSHEPYMKLVAGELLARPWFTRVWVFQELVLSKDPWVQCGKSRLKWAVFCRALLDDEHIDHANFNAPTNPEYVVPEHPNSMLATLRSLRDFRSKHRIETVEQQGVPKRTLVDLVRSRRGLGASDPRDIIYAHMGLVQMLAKPNYMNLYRVGSISSLDEIKDRQEIENIRLVNKNRFDLGTSEYHKPVQEVFMDFAYDVINCCGHLRIFCYKETLCPSERLPHFASWAPDWSVHSLKQPQIIEEDWTPTSSFRSLPRLSWIPNSRLLLLPGHVFGSKATNKILNVSSVIPWEPLDIDMVGDEQNVFSNDLASFIRIFRDDALRRQWCVELYRKVYVHYCKNLGLQSLPLRDVGSVVLWNLTDTWDSPNMDGWLPHLI